MSKILMITPYTPDNLGVGVSYTSQLIEELSKEHKIDLIYFRYSNESPYSPPNDNIKVLYEKEINLTDKLFAISHNPIDFPLFTVRYDRKIKDLLQNTALKEIYDFIYLDFSQTFIYVNYINHPRLILMAHDVIAQKYSRMKTYLRPWAMRTEKKLLKKGTIVFTFSKKDCNLISNLYGIDSFYTSFFIHKNVVAATPKLNSQYFVFFGSWGRPENSEGLVWFIDNVLPLIPNNDFSFKIIGGGLSEDIKNKIKPYSNIEYLGFVDNPYQIIADAKAEIAPLFKGAGVKVKCVEALASGTPVIGTDVAMEGIEEFSQYFTLVTTPEEFANTITNCKYSLQQKLDIKKNFLYSYNNKKILQYIETNGN